MSKLWFMWVVLCCAVALPAEAQLSRGTLRISIDADMLSLAGIELDPEGPGGEYEGTVFGFGPNQHGGSRVSGGPTPFGLGFGWVLTQKIILGARLGLGLDVLSDDDNDDDDNTRYVGLSIMPGITFVPVGHRAKLFLSASPIIQWSRTKTGSEKDRTLLGGFGLGIGVLIFTLNSLSVDLGFHFEGRFGNLDDDRGNDDFETHIRDLRGVVRLGISIWK
jgi:hypothetical protein